jgi:hypothetical protein
MMKPIRTKNNFLTYGVVEEEGDVPVHRQLIPVPREFPWRTTHIFSKRIEDNILKYLLFCETSIAMLKQI